VARPAGIAAGRANHFEHIVQQIVTPVALQRGWYARLRMLASMRGC